MIRNAISLVIYAAVMMLALINCLIYIPNIIIAFLAYVVIGLGLGWFLKMIFNRKNKKSVNVF
ncbi:MAG: hypothetical protein MR750_06595 [Methanobrevibacter boviskoreani]|uniref:hypothetical protein n=1 Tax=Methanobrevibacter boviskoreani TaxID=1348249 RepID=UPI0023A825B6|nr:hypothetical protein [Methanobrevibacter boviskoreani]MCI6930899.1 hypothetical protein [Methanobrevibacter boviskoreani]